MSDNFEAKISPNPDGSWKVEVYEKNGKGSDTLRRYLGRQTRSGALWKKGAERKARRMLSRVRKSQANLDRKSKVIT